jgi:hypothetical protein
MDEMASRWYTVLTVVVVLFCFGALANSIYRFSLLSVTGFAVWIVLTYWVLEGCARRGEPVARWILRRSK